MDALLEVEVVSTGTKIWLPADVAHRMAALGRVRLPAPKADLRYAQPGKLPLAATWQGNRFWPANYSTRQH